MKLLFTKQAETFAGTPDGGDNPGVSCAPSLVAEGPAGVCGPKCHRTWVPNVPLTGGPCLELDLIAVGGEEPVAGGQGQGRQGQGQGWQGQGMLL